MLEVTEDAYPFVKGLNVIVIPVNLYTHTKLNSLVLNEQPPAELDGAKFYGMDREAETVSEHVEGTISKSGVSPANALAILALLLQNETGYLVYAYYLAETTGEVELRGLAQDILELIPFDGKAFQNGPTGDIPKGFWDWLVSIFVTIVTFIVGSSWRSQGSSCSYLRS